MQLEGMQHGGCRRRRPCPSAMHRPCRLSWQSRSQASASRRPLPVRQTQKLRRQTSMGQEVVAWSQKRIVLSGIESRKYRLHLRIDHVRGSGPIIREKLGGA